MFEVSSLRLVCVVFLSLSFSPLAEASLPWSQELQCYLTRNASLVGLKYTYVYLRSVKIVSGLIFRIFY